MKFSIQARDVFLQLNSRLVGTEQMVQDPSYTRKVRIQFLKRAEQIQHTFILAGIQKSVNEEEEEN